MAYPICGRFQIVGYNGADSDGIDMVETREEALAIAALKIGPKHYERCIVFDVMARRGAPNEWDHTGAVVGRRDR